MVEEIPTFESMFRKSKGLDLAEEASSEEESMKKSERYAPDREVLERLATLSPEMQRKVLDQIDKLDPSAPWDIKPKFSDVDGGWESKEKEVVTPEMYMPGEGGWTSGSWNPVEKSVREMVARNCFEKTGRIPDVEFMDTYEVKKAADESDFNEMSDGFAAYNKEKEIQDTIDREHEEMKESGIEDGPDYRLAERVIRDDIEEGSETDAGLEAYNKYDRKKNKPIRKELSDTANWMSDAAADTAIAMAKDPTPQSRTSALMEGDLAGEIAADIPGIYHEVNPFLNKSEEFFTALDALLKKNPNITSDMIVRYMQPAKVGYNQGYKRRSQERINDSLQ